VNPSALVALIRKAAQTVGPRRIGEGAMHNVVEPDLTNRLMGGRVQQGFSPAAAADSPFPDATTLEMRKQYGVRPDPVPPEPTHGFDLADYDGGPALGIEGVRYEPRRTPVEDEIATLRRLADSSEEGNQDAQTRLYDLTQNAKSWEDVPSSEFGDELLSMRTAKPPAELSRFLAGVRRTAFGAIPETQQQKIIHESAAQKVFATDNPTQGNAGGRSVRLSEGRAALVPGDKVGKGTSPYPELLEALQSGAIRGSFTEALDPSWKVGATVPLRLNRTTTMPVTIRSISPYNPKASSLERTKAMGMLGRTVQDLDTYSKPGHIVEFDITDSAIVPRLTPEMEVGNVVPIQRKNGKTHQMEIVGIQDVPNGQKKLILRTVAGEGEGEKRASALMALDAVAKERAGDPEAVDMLAAMTPEVQKIFKGKLVYFNEEKGRPGLFDRGSARDQQAGTIERTGANLDLSKGQGYGVFSKRGKNDTRSWHWAGTKAHPLDRTYRRWVLVRTGTQKYGVKPGTQGAEMLQIDDAGFVTRLVIDPKGESKVAMRTTATGEVVPDRRAYTSIFPKEIADRIKQFLDPEKAAKAETSRAAYKASKTGKPAPGTAGEKVKQVSNEFAVLSKRLDDASRAEGKPSPTVLGEPRKMVPTEDKGVMRSGTREYVATERPQGAREERLRDAVVQSLGAKKKSKDLQFEGDVDPRDAEVDSIIAKIDSGERLKGSDIALMETMVDENLLNEFLDNRPRMTLAGAQGPAKFSLTGKGPREMEANSQTQVGYKREVVDEMGGKEGIPLYQKGLPVAPKSTYRGKPTKAGLPERKSPVKNEALTVVEKISSADVKKNPDTVFLATMDTSHGNVINIRKIENLADALAGKRDIVISKDTLSKLTAEEKTALKTALKGRFTAKPKPVAKAATSKPPNRYEVEMQKVRERMAQVKSAKKADEPIKPATGNEYEAVEMRKDREKEKMTKTLAWIQSVKGKR
jgi:hypothetical protein